mgnify:FL=1
MKFSCSQLNLEEALNIVNKAVTPNTTLQILNNILLRAEGDKLYFFSTNLEIAIKYFIPSDVYSEGSITVPAKLITNYISLLKNEKIEFALIDGNTLSLNSSSSHTKIKGLSVDEFPSPPKIQTENIFNVNVSDFDLAILQTAFSASGNTSRPALSGVLFQVDKDVLKIVATDSYRLAEKCILLKEKIGLSFSSIVPARTVMELGKILSKFHEKGRNVEVNFTKNQALFRVGNIELVSRLIEGKFPDYERIIPKSTKTKVTVNTEEFALVVKRVSLFARENSNNIKLSITNDGKLLVTTDETKIGEEKAEIKVEVDGENNKTSLNAEYLLDVLTFIQTDKIILEVDDKLSPIVVRPANKKDYVYIIMPLKT